MQTLLIRTRIALIGAALLAMVGCGTTPPSNFYQLDEPAGIRLSGMDRGVAVGVELVNVAPYIDRPQIVMRGTTGHKLQLSEFNRWAEPLKDSIVRVIIVNLSNMLESTRVYKIPRRNKAIPLEFRLEIDIARFDGTLGGDAVLVTRWTLYGSEDTALLTKISIINEPSFTEPPVEEPSIDERFDTLIAAQNRTLQRLSQEIVGAIEANR